MSYLVLARKYRPQSFEQVVKQAHVTQTLKNAIAAERVAHAILFAGPRGTGKTTVARILAKAMNCEQGPTGEPCNTCRSCKEITAGHGVDVFEIDGASNNSVDQVRELRENIRYMPAHSLYKIYIIDEVHMLSIAAFNALLKTLEEPPAHVLFLFATTEPHKIPITILSRCQRHDFRRIDLAAIAEHMQRLCAEEQVEIARESLWVIAREAGGSMRDALSLLDQVMACSQGAITHAQVLDILGVVDRKVLYDISAATLQGQVAALLEILDEVYDRGHDIKKLYSDLLEHFRNLLVVKLGQRIEKLVDLPGHEIDLMQEQVRDVSAAFLCQIFDLLFKEEAAVRWSAQPKLTLEMTFIRLFQAQPVLPIDHLIEKLDALAQGSSRAAAAAPSEPDNPNQAHVPAPAPAQEKPFRAENDALVRKDGPKQAPSGEGTPSTPEAQWAKVLELVSQKYPALAPNLAHSTLKTLTDQGLEIEVAGSEFSLNMIRRSKNLDNLKKVCLEVFGKPLDIVISAKPGRDNETQKKKQANQLKQEALSHPLVSDALEVFDGKIIDVKIL